MSKLTEIKADAEKLGIDTSKLKDIPSVEKAIANYHEEEEIQAGIAAATAQPTREAEEKKEEPILRRMSKGITGIDPDARLRLYKKGGKAVMLTLEDALRKHNFKQLSVNSQKALTMGKSATKMIAEIMEERNQ